MQVLHPSAMFPAQICSDPLRIRVRNSYNLDAPGSTICYDRDISCSLLTSIVLKPDVHLLDVVSTRMLGNFGFLARVFDIFKQVRELQSHRRALHAACLQVLMWPFRASG